MKLAHASQDCRLPLLYPTHACACCACSVRRWGVASKEATTLGAAFGLRSTRMPPPVTDIIYPTWEARLLSLAEALLRAPVALLGLGAGEPQVQVPGGERAVAVGADRRAAHGGPRAPRPRRHTVRAAVLPAPLAAANSRSGSAEMQCAMGWSGLIAKIVRHTRCKHEGKCHPSAHLI